MLLSGNVILPLLKDKRLTNESVSRFILLLWGLDHRVVFRLEIHRKLYYLKMRAAHVRVTTLFAWLELKGEKFST